jgi:hypothetical protein
MNDAELRAAYARLLVTRRGTGRSGCPGPEALHRAIVRRGPEPERLATVNHAMDCPACLREFETLRSLEYAVPAERLMPRWLAVAATVVVILGAGFLWRGSRGAPGDVMRGGDVIELVSPRSTTRPSPPVQLVWRALPGAKAYLVEIVADDGRAVLTRVTTDTTLLADAGLEFDHAYIWRIAAATGSRDSAHSAPARFRVSAP